MSNMIVCTYEPELQWARHWSWTRKKMLTGKSNCKQKSKLQSTVWNVALYAVETWTLTKASKKLLEAFEMWTWQKMLKISWTEKVTNEEVLVRADEARSILKMIWHKKGEAMDS